MLIRLLAEQGSSRAWHTVSIHICCRVLTAVEAIRSSLADILTQIITGSHVTGDHLCKSVGEYSMSSLHPGFKDRQDNINNAHKRVSFFTRLGVPPFKGVLLFLPSDKIDRSHLVRCHHSGGSEYGYISVHQYIVMSASMSNGGKRARVTKQDFPPIRMQHTRLRIARPMHTNATNFLYQFLKI